MKVVVKDILAIDGGHEKNCTVLALALAAQIPYELAFDIAKKAGRKDNEPMSSTVLLKKFNKEYSYLGTFKKVKRSPITVQKFCKQFSEGRYYVRKSKHAFSVINGDVHDNHPTKPRERILDAWKFCVDKTQPVTDDIKHAR